MNRVLLPAAALAFAALAAAGCKPPAETSEFNNSGLSVALAADPSKVPAAPANPAPNIAVPAPESAAAQPAESTAGPAAPAKPVQ